MEKIKEIEGIDYVICKICDKRSSRLYGKHLQSHNITSQEYKERFPGALLTTKKDKERTSKNSGLHMKQEKYKKMFSDKIIGEKNPNHRSKTTDKQRKERSPFSKDFKNYNNENERQEFIKSVAKKRNYTTRIEYYLEQGYDEETSEKNIKR